MERTRAAVAGAAGAGSGDRTLAADEERQRPRRQRGWPSVAVTPSSSRTSIVRNCSSSTSKRISSTRLRGRYAASKPMPPGVRPPPRRLRPRPGRRTPRPPGRRTSPAPCRARTGCARSLSRRHVHVSSGSGALKITSGAGPCRGRDRRDAAGASAGGSASAMLGRVEQDHARRASATRPVTSQPASGVDARLHVELEPVALGLPPDHPDRGVDGRQHEVPAAPSRRGRGRSPYRLRPRKRPETVTARIQVRGGVERQRAQRDGRAFAGTTRVVRGRQHQQLAHAGPGLAEERRPRAARTAGRPCASRRARAGPRRRIVPTPRDARPYAGGGRRHVERHQRCSPSSTRYVSTPSRDRVGLHDDLLCRGRRWGSRTATRGWRRAGPRSGPRPPPGE